MMESIHKQRWYEKKTLWGIILAGAGAAAAAIPGCPEWVTPILEAVGGALGIYGVTEIGRSYARGRVQTAQAAVDAMRNPNNSPTTD